MLIIDYIDTNEVTKFTDVRMRFTKLGKSEITVDQRTFKDRFLAVNYVNATVHSYFVTNVEIYMRGCEYVHEQYNERFGDSKKKALQIIDRYHAYICDKRMKWPETLQFYLRIHAEFGKLLPSKQNMYYNTLKGQVDTFHTLASEFFIEFSNGYLLDKYQPKTIAKAS